MKKCEIFTTKGERTNLKPNNIDEFQYHETKTRRQQTHTVIHRIIIDKQYHEIKKNDTILKSLKQNNCHLQFHEWDTNQWDIISIGFISGSSPKHQSKQTLQNKLDSNHESTPNYKLHATSLKLIDEGKAYRTMTYEVQCLRENYNEVCEYVAAKCKVLSQTFIKYQWKHASPTTYQNGIKKQITFIDSIQTIPIYGIHPKAMDRLHHRLTNDIDILEISNTGKTATHGRWNVYVTMDNFETQTKWFQNNLKKIYNDNCHNLSTDVPAEFVPEVRFNSTIVFNKKEHDPLLEDAETSVSSFTNTSIDSRSWASVASASKDKSFQTISTITSTNNLSTQMTQLSQSIEKICERLDRLEERMNKQDEAIQSYQQYEKAIPNMDRLAELIEKLEERTANITPRRLELYYNEQNAPNKKRNINNTPTKDRERN